MFDSLETAGREALRGVENLLHEGNTRKILVTQGETKIVELPLTLGIVGAVLAPSVAVLGGVAAIATGCKVEVERTDPRPSSLAEDA